jgi:hypothetical protein
VVGLFGDVPWLRLGESWAVDDLGDDPAERDRALLERARRIRAAAATAVGLAVAVRDTGGDTDVAMAVVTPDHEGLEHRTAFLGGSNGRLRGALAAASFLFVALREAGAARDPAAKGV